MKIFVATNTGQSARANDFHDAEEGELLTFAIECERDEQDCDGKCGCRRSLLGIETGGTTTTFVVAEIPLKPAEYEQLVVDFFCARGWFDSSDEEAVHIFRNDARIIAEAAKDFTVGIVLEKRDDVIQTRQPLQKSLAFMIARGRTVAKSQSVTA